MNIIDTIFFKLNPTIADVREDLAMLVFIATKEKLAKQHTIQMIQEKTELLNYLLSQRK